MTDVLLLGEPLVLLTSNEIAPLSESKNFSLSLAGSELNVAIGLTRLGYSVTYISQLGNDAMGQYIEKEIKRQGIGTDYISFNDGSFTGLMMKNRVLENDPEICYFRKGSAFSYLDCSLIDHIDFTNIKHIHLTGIPLALSKSVRESIFYLIKKAKEYHIYLSFDPNIRESLWDSKEEMIEIMNQVAKEVHMFMPGINEARLLSNLDNKEEIAAFYQDFGIETVVIKLGEQGAFVRDKETSYVVSGYQIEEVVDTVGAGDGFAVGMISGRLEGKVMADIVKRANAIGAMQVMTLGDNEGLPTQRELEGFMDLNDN